VNYARRSECNRCGASRSDLTGGTGTQGGSGDGQRGGKLLLLFVVERLTFLFCLFIVGGFNHGNNGPRRGGGYRGGRRDVGKIIHLLL